MWHQFCKKYEIVSPYHCKKILRCGYFMISCNIAIFVSTTSQEVCRISIGNDVRVSHVTIILLVIIPYPTGKITYTTLYCNYTSVMEE